jgi:ABC-type branched-subunit amino acid transport system substrate-binding protein
MCACRLRPAILSISALILASCGGGDPEHEATPSESWHPETTQSSTLKIQYFWSTSGDENQYSSTMTGIKAAEQSDDVQELETRLKLIELVPRKDPESQQEAVQLAGTLRRSPDTLAVIGHTRSGTTLATLPLYAEAGIPVLIPTATSPYLLYRHRPDEIPVIDVTKLDPNLPRFANAFRLPPSDVPDQVHALELTIKQIKQTMKLHEGEGRAGEGRAKVMLVCDTTARYRADIYTKPMCDALAAEANTDADYKIASSRRIDLDNGDIWGLVTELHAVDPDFVVLIGYQELTRDVLQEITERAGSSGKPIGRYTFIMTEDSLHNELLKFFPPPQNVFPQHIYVTSPVGPRRQAPARPDECSSRDTKIGDVRKDQKVLNIADTDEGFAYDSVLILAGAAKNCNERHALSRACVLEYLRQNQHALQGACETYHLDEGERENAFYYVYSINAHDSKREFNPQWSARKEDSTLRPVTK